jgi:2-C-methyl-D-erythritol 4-phosphate cytidylyltransferase
MAIAIIVAGGKGVRMNNTMRKQYLPLAEHQVIGHTLLAFKESKKINHIYLVVPKDDFAFCKDNVLLPLKLEDNISLVSGGPKRQDSVYKGLLAVNSVNADCDDSIVVIHDGVRPFVTGKQIDACINGANEYNACILGIPAVDTLKEVNSSGFIRKTIRREAIWLAQTPQAFKYSIIKRAHEHARENGYQGTDDASLVEKLNVDVRIIKGSNRNIKITTKDDLSLAKAMMANPHFS